MMRSTRHILVANLDEGRFERGFANSELGEPLLHGENLECISNGGDAPLGVRANWNPRMSTPTARCHVGTKCPWEKWGSGIRWI